MAVEYVESPRTTLGLRTCFAEATQCYVLVPTTCVCVCVCMYVCVCSVCVCVCFT